MSRRKITGIATIIALSMFVGTELRAQSPFLQRNQVRSPARPPVVSPYLNLLRRGGSTASNYYNLVRPQQEFRRNIQKNRQSLRNVRRETQSLRQQQSELLIQRKAAGSTLLQTGHSASFRYPGASMGRGRR